MRQHSWLPPGTDLWCRVFLHQGSVPAPQPPPSKKKAGVMVAPRNVDKPVSTLVRVRGDGRAAKALCWDLSRCSSMVAAVAPLQLPPQRPPPPRSKLPPSAGAGLVSTAPTAAGPKQAPSLPGSRQQLPRPVALPGPADVPSEGKRLLEEEEEGGRQKDGHKPKVARTAKDTGMVQQRSSGPAPPQPAPEEEVQRLRLQCRRLQQQNDDLQRRLGEVFSLLKDKQRRTRLMSQLDVLVK